MIATPFINSFDLGLEHNEEIKEMSLLERVALKHRLEKEITIPFKSSFRLLPVKLNGKRIAWRESLTDAIARVDGQFESYCPKRYGVTASCYGTFQYDRWTVRVHIVIEYIESCYINEYQAKYQADKEKQYWDRI